MKNFSLLTFSLLLFLGSKSSVFCQIQPEDDYKIQTFKGYRCSTDGIIGFSYRRGYVIDVGKQQIWGFDITNIEHEKETRLVHPSTGNSFILGKALYFFTLRPEYGVRDRLFRRANKDGIEINWIWSIGPSIGILKPYYIQYQSLSNYQPFDPKVHDPQNLFWQNQDVLGSGGFFRGFSRIKLEPGIHGKLSFDLEWGNDFENLNSVEAGIMLDVYLHKILIIPQAENKSTYFSIF